MPRLNAQDRERALRQLQAGSRPEDVAVTFGVHISTIYRLSNHFQLTQSTQDRPRRGRPRVTSGREDRHIVREHTRDRFRSASTTARNTVGTHGRTVSHQTIARRLREANIRCRRPYRGAILTPHHRQIRLGWARNHINWRLRDWSRVLFTGESLFCVYALDSRRRIYRRPGERLNDACILQRDRWGGIRVLVWGGITHNMRVGPVFFLNQAQGQGRGVTAQRYIHEVLQPHIVPFFQQHQNFPLQKDNARPHTARVTQQFLQRNGIPLLPHPARSPDLNPIEHFWDEIGRQLQGRQHMPQTVQELQDAIQEIWRTIPRHRTNNLVASMYRRCRAVINANGGHTRY